MQLRGKKQTCRTESYASLKSGHIWVQLNELLISVFVQIKWDLYISVQIKIMQLNCVPSGVPKDGAWNRKVQPLMISWPLVQLPLRFHKLISVVFLKKVKSVP